MRKDTGCIVVDILMCTARHRHHNNHLLSSMVCQKDTMACWDHIAPCQLALYGRQKQAQDGKSHEAVKESKKRHAYVQRPA